MEDTMKLCMTLTIEIVLQQMLEYMQPRTLEKRELDVCVYEARC